MQVEARDVAHELNTRSHWTLGSLLAWFQRCQNSLFRLCEDVVRTDDKGTKINVTSLQLAVHLLDCLWSLAVLPWAPLHSAPAFAERPSASEIKASLEFHGAVQLAVAAGNSTLTTARQRQIVLQKATDVFVRCMQLCTERSFGRKILPDAVRTLLVAETWQRADVAERRRRRPKDEKTWPCSQIQRILLRCDPETRANAAFLALAVGQPSVPISGRPQTLEERRGFAASRCYGRLAEAVIRWVVAGPGGLSAVSRAALDGLRSDVVKKSADRLSASVAGIDGLAGSAILPSCDAGRTEGLGPDHHVNVNSTWPASMGPPPSEFAVGGAAYVRSVASQALCSLKQAVDDEVIQEMASASTHVDSPEVLGPGSAGADDHADSGLPPLDPVLLVAVPVVLRYLSLLTASPHSSSQPQGVGECVHGSSSIGNVTHGGQGSSSKPTSPRDNAVVPAVKHQSVGTDAQTATITMHIAAEIVAPLAGLLVHAEPVSLRSHGAGPCGRNAAHISASQRLNERKLRAIIILAATEAWPAAGRTAVRGAIDATQHTMKVLNPISASPVADGRDIAGLSAAGLATAQQSGNQFFREVNSSSRILRLLLTSTDITPGAARAATGVAIGWLLVDVLRAQVVAPKKLKQSISRSTHLDERTEASDASDAFDDQTDVDCFCDEPGQLSALSYLRDTVIAGLRVGGKAACEDFIAASIAAARLVELDNNPRQTSAGVSRTRNRKGNAIDLLSPDSVIAEVSKNEDLPPIGSVAGDGLRCIIAEVATVLRQSDLVDMGLPGVALSSILRRIGVRVESVESGPQLQEVSALDSDRLELEFLVELMSTMGPGVLEGDPAGMARFGANVIAQQANTVRHLVGGIGAMDTDGSRPEGGRGSIFQEGQHSHLITLFIGACKLVQGIANAVEMHLASKMPLGVSDVSPAQDVIGLDVGECKAALRIAVDALIPLRIFLAELTVDSSQGLLNRLLDSIVAAATSILAAGVAPPSSSSERADLKPVVTGSTAGAAGDLTTQLRTGIQMLMESSPALQGGGLAIIADSLRCASDDDKQQLEASNGGLLARVVRLGCSHLEASDSYVHLAAVSLLEAAGQCLPMSVLPMLARLAGDMRRPLKGRTRLFLALLKVAGRAGELLPAYARAVIGACMQIGCAGADPPIDATLWYAGSAIEEDAAAEGRTGSASSAGGIDLAGDDDKVAGGAVLVRDALQGDVSMSTGSQSQMNDDVSRSGFDGRVTRRLLLGLSGSVGNPVTSSNRVMSGRDSQGKSMEVGTARSKIFERNLELSGDASDPLEAAMVRMHLEWLECKASALSACASTVASLAAAGGHAFSLPLLEDCVGGAAAVLRSRAARRAQGGEMVLGPDVAKALRMGESKVRRACTYLLYRLVDAVPERKLTETLAHLLRRVLVLARESADLDDDLTVRGHARSCVGQLQRLVQQEVEAATKPSFVRVGLRPTLV